MTISHMLIYQISSTFGYGIVSLKYILRRWRQY